MASGAEPVFHCARDIVALVLEKPSPSLADLAVALDRLAAAYADAPPGAFSADAGYLSKPPSRGLIGSRFPELGLYATADSLDLTFPDLTGDGIDDLVDIVEQMRQILAILEVLGPDDALYDLHQLAFHWMAHVRDLGRYLHALRYRLP